VPRKDAQFNDHLFADTCNSDERKKLACIIDEGEMSEMKQRSLINTGDGLFGEYLLRIRSIVKKMGKEVAYSGTVCPDHVGLVDLFYIRRSVSDNGYRLSVAD